RSGQLFNLAKPGGAQPPGGPLPTHPERPCDLLAGRRDACGAGKAKSTYGAYWPGGIAGAPGDPAIGPGQAFAGSEGSSDPTRPARPRLRRDCPGLEGSPGYGEIEN